MAWRRPSTRRWSPSRRTVAEDGPRTRVEGGWGPSPAPGDSALDDRAGGAGRRAEPPAPRGPAMSHIILGVTGSVAAVRTPALFAALRAQGHQVRVVATEPALYFFDPDELGPSDPDRRWPSVPRRRRMARRTLSARRPGPAHRLPPLGRPAGRRPPRCQHAGQVRPRPERQPPDLPVPRLGLPQAGDPGPRHEHPDVGQPRDPAAPAATARRPRRRPRRRRLDPGRGRRGLRPPRPRARARPAPEQAPGLRRRRPRRHGRGRRHRRGRPGLVRRASD
jgi:hypothetical protein